MAQKQTTSPKKQNQVYKSKKKKKTKKNATFAPKQLPQLLGDLQRRRWLRRRRRADEGALIGEISETDLVEGGSVKKERSLEGSTAMYSRRVLVKKKLFEPKPHWRNSFSFDPTPKKNHKSVAHF